jgi:hypothetical protein
MRESSRYALQIADDALAKAQMPPELSSRPDSCRSDLTTQGEQSPYLADVSELAGERLNAVHGAPCELADNMLHRGRKVFPAIPQ